MHFRTCAIETQLKAQDNAFGILQGPSQQPWECRRDYNILRSRGEGMRRKPDEGKEEQEAKKGLGAGGEKQGKVVCWFAF